MADIAAAFGPRRRRRRGPFDLGSIASVRARGGRAILARCDRIDVLVNNAGVVLSESPRDRRRLRGDVRRQPPRALRPHRAAARADQAECPGPHRQRGLDGPQRGPQGPRLRRPAVDSRLRRDAGLLEVETGQHLLHDRARPTTRGHRRHRQLPSPRHRGHRVRPRRRLLRCARLRAQGHQALHPRRRARGAHIDLPGLVSRRRRRHGPVLREVQDPAAVRRGPTTTRRPGGCGRRSEEIVAQTRCDAQPTSPMYASRRWSPTSAGEPVRTSRPFTMTAAWSAMASAVWANCSTSRMVMPSSATAWATSS